MAALEALLGFIVVAVVVAPATADHQSPSPSITIISDVMIMIAAMAA